MTLICGPEPLSWDVLDYWRAKHPDDGPSCMRPAPIIVARRDGRVVGFGALGANISEEWPGPIIRPLFADNIWIGLRILRALEDEIELQGEACYYFYTKGILVQEAIRMGRWTRLMDDEHGRTWFSRELPAARRRATA